MGHLFHVSSYQGKGRQSKVSAPIEQHVITVAGCTDEAGNPLKLAIVVTPDGRAYLPLTFLCGVLGIVDVRQQRERIQAHEVLRQLLSMQFIQSKKGIREGWCLERRAVGFWMGSLQASKVRAEVRPRLIEFQWAVVDAVDRLLFGEVESSPVRAQLTTHEGRMASHERFMLALESRIGRVEEHIIMPEED